MNWTDRFVPPRRREVLVSEETFDQVFLCLPEGRRLVREIQVGSDLTPFLSNRPSEFQYERSRRSRKGIDWSDKDYALNALDVHHLHLKETRRRRANSRELVFVRFTREHALLIAFGDHNSFDGEKLEAAVGKVNKKLGLELFGIDPGVALSFGERNALRRRGVITCIDVDGVAVAPGFLSSAGTSMLHSRHADSIVYHIQEFERLIEDDVSSRILMKRFDIDFSVSPIWSWRLEHGDLVLLEEVSNKGMRIVEWRR